MTAGPPILELDKVNLRFGGVRAMTDVSCRINTGELFSIIGPNGAGKTSTLNCISGRYQPTSGRILHKGRDITSLGARKRVELARAIALNPEVILLDEPMAGMNLEEKEDMARFIVDLNEELGMTVVMIEHDMGVVMDLSHRLMVLDFGRKIAEGVPNVIKANEDVKRAYLGQDHGTAQSIADGADAVA